MNDVLTAGFLFFILISTISLVVLIDIVQGHDLYEVWFSLSKFIRLAKGEDYFLIVIFLMILLLLILSHKRRKK